MSSSITQWEVFPGSIDGHEVRSSPSARRATCSCGEWSIYGVAPRDLPAAAADHIAVSIERELGRRGLFAWTRERERASMGHTPTFVPQSRGEQLIEELGGAAAARKATHPDTRDPDAGFTDEDFRAVQAAVGLGVMEGGRG